MKFEIKNRFSEDVQFTAEIDCAEDTPISVKIGLAVKWGVETGANLYRANLYRAKLDGANLEGTNLEGANLGGANLNGANLKGANLKGANLNGANLKGANLDGANLDGANLDGACLQGASGIVDGGSRSDGHRFVGWVKNGVLQIRAGCRNLSITEGRQRWVATRAGTTLGDETTAILDQIEAMARIRKLVR